MSDTQDRVESIAREVVAANAQRVDAEGVFPEESMNALREAGLFGLISAKGVGGEGEGHLAAARVVERLGRECASTAMITCMHYCGTWVIENHGAEDVRREIAAGRHLTTFKHV